MDGHCSAAGAEQVAGESDLESGGDSNDEYAVSQSVGGQRKRLAIDDDEGQLACFVCVCVFDVVWLLANVGVYGKLILVLPGADGISSAYRSRPKKAKDLCGVCMQRPILCKFQCSQCYQKVRLRASAFVPARVCMHASAKVTRKLSTPTRRPPARATS